MIIKQTLLKLKTDPPLIGHGNSLRGYVAGLFPQYDLLHNHNKDGILLYLYPRVHYKVINGDGYIIGIDEGSSLTRHIEPALETIRLKGNIYSIVQKQLISENVQFRISDSAVSYSFIKPWLALNEQNYQDYIKAGTKRKRDFILKNIFKGNLLSLSKSLGYIVTEEIQITSLNLEERGSYLKSTPMLGFLGTFSVNFEIPDYWGIGKSVSRGFGTVKRDKKD